MFENPDQKPNFIKYEGRSFFTEKGLYADAKNIWTPLQGMLVSLQIAERRKKMERTTEIMGRLNAPRQTYKEYIQQRYSENDSQEILESSSPASMTENDNLVAEYNQLAESHQITPEIATNFMQKGLEIFTGPATMTQQEKIEGEPKG